MNIKVYGNRWTLVATGKFYCQNRRGSGILIQPSDALPGPDDRGDDAILLPSRGQVLDLGGVSDASQKWYARCESVFNMRKADALRVFEYA